MWTSHPSCKEMIQLAWRSQNAGSRAAQLYSKLQKVRPDSSSWNKTVFGKVEPEIKNKLALLQDIQNTIVNEDDVRREKCIRGEVEDLLNKEEQMWAQKARCDWILKGDRNKRFFQTIVKQRRAKSSILQRKDRNENLTDKPEDIEGILVERFKSSYEDQNALSVDDILQELQGINIPQLTAQQCLELSKPITNFEI